MHRYVRAHVMSVHDCISECLCLKLHVTLLVVFGIGLDNEAVLHPNILNWFRC